MNETIHIPARLFDRGHYRSGHKLVTCDLRICILGYALGGKQPIKMLFAAAEKQLNMDKKSFVSTIQRLRSHSLLEVIGDGTVQWWDYELDPALYDGEPRPHSKAWESGYLDSPEIIEILKSHILGDGGKQGLLASLSADEIHVFFNLMREGSEALMGVNAAFVMYRLPTMAKIVNTYRILDEYLQPDYDAGRRFLLHPKLVERTDKRPGQLIGLIRSLVEKGLFKWQAWSAYHREEICGWENGVAKIKKIGLVPSFFVDRNFGDYADRIVISCLAKYSRGKTKYKPILLLRCFFDPASVPERQKRGWSVFSREVSWWQDQKAKAEQKKQDWIDKNLNSPWQI